MKNMTLENIAEACGGSYFGKEQEKQTEIRGAVTDSRQVEEGFLFIPVKGARVDGHDFIPQVCEKGAAAVLTEKKLENCEKPYILVQSCLRALKDIAGFYRSQLNIPIVGITGSVGKTSTKEMIASVLSEKYHVLKTAGNFNNEIGLPLTLLRIQEEHEAAVVEMGISDFGEMHRLAKMAQPDICVITNIGICHLENLKTRDGILKAKSEIFDYLKPEGHIILNGEDDKLSTLTEVKGIRPTFYGFGEMQPDICRSGEEGKEGRKLGMQKVQQDIYADHIQNCGLKGMEADIHTPAGTISVHIPIPGRHNIYNAMAAAGAALALNMELEDIKAGIEKAEAIGGRTNLIETGGLMLIDDCYNANPVSMRASLDVLSNGLARTVAVLGDMGELGEHEKRLHYEIGVYAAEKQIDTLFCAGVLSKEMAEGACDTNDWCEVFHFDTKDEMLPQLLEYLQEGDTVLVKASHFMDYPKIVEAVREKFHSAS
jgi:UDP-N-acetylmuramoyl-tripeptide--D-alanyl-D-alanine ligase